MLHEKSFEPIAQPSFLLCPFHQALIEYHANAHIAALERNPPTPPAIADDVIGRGPADAMSRGSKLRILLGKLAAIPILYAAPPGPACGGGVLGILPPPAIFSRK